MSCADPQRLQEICNGLTATKVEGLGRNRREPHTPRYRLTAFDSNSHPKNVTKKGLDFSDREI